MARHGTSCPGVGVLPSPETPADLVYEPENLVVMLSFWRKLYEFVILDTPDRTETGIVTGQVVRRVTPGNDQCAAGSACHQNTLAHLEHRGVKRSQRKLVVNR